MKLSLPPLPLFLFLAPTLAIGANACTPPETLFFSPHECKCGEDLRSLKITSPYKGLSLHSVCNYKKVNGEATGLFYFKGEFIAKGNLRREENSVIGDHLSLYGQKINPSAPFHESSVDFKFYNIEQAISKFKTPELSSKVNCWSASVKFIVNDLHILKDGGTDLMGNYPTKYRVVDIGKYEKCVPFDNS